VLFLVVLLFAGLARGQAGPISKPTIILGPAVWTQATSAEFWFTSSDAGVSFECRLDDGPEVPCTSPWVYPSLSEGGHIFQVKAILGDEDRHDTWQWTVDLTPPTLPQDMTLEATSPSGTPVVFEAADNFDVAPGLDCTPASGSTFALGTTNVTCTATDEAGNSSGEGMFAVTVVDTTPPVLAPHQDVLADQQSAAGASVDYDLPTVTDNGDPAPVVDCAPASGGTFPIGSTPISCSAEDASGNTSSPLGFQVVVQQGAIPSAPQVESDVGALTKQTSAQFTFSVPAALTVECRLESSTDVGSFGPCESAGSQSYTGLSDGSYLFTLRVTNGIGNVNTTTHAWTVDTAPPAAVVGLRSRFGNGWIKLLWNKPTEVDYSHVGIWRKRVGSSDWKRVGTRRAGVAYLDDPVPNDVRFEYALRSIDSAGNRSPAATVAGRASRILSPRFGAVVGSPPVIDWTSVGKATYYNMQLWREGRKILSVWPSRSSYRLRAGWNFGGRHYALRQGTYRVYVWPGFGAKSAVNYGGLLGWTSFTVG
jgi:HYR domain